MLSPLNGENAHAKVTHTHNSTQVVGRARERTTEKDSRGGEGGDGQLQGRRTWEARRAEEEWERKEGARGEGREYDGRDKPTE